MNHSYDWTDKPRRFLGLDLFRFFGFMLVVGFHLGITSQRPFIGSELPLTPNMQWPTFFDVGLMETYGLASMMLSPTNIIYFVAVFIAVPVFIMLSGMFAFGNAKEDEFWRKTLGRIRRLAISFLVIVGASIIFGWVLNGGPASGNYLLDLIQVLGGINVLTPLKQAVAEKGGFMPETLHMWYMWVLIGLTLIAPVFQPLFVSGHVKTIRYVMAAGIIGAYVFPMITRLGMLVSGEGTAFYEALDKLVLFDVMAYINPYLMMFLYGAWVNMDKAIGDRIVKRRYRTYGLLMIPSFILMSCRVLRVGALMPLEFTNPYFRVGVLSTASFYWPITFVPMITLVFGLFYKLSWDIQEDSSLGRFIMGYAKYTGRGYMIHFLVYAAVIVVINRMAGPVSLESLGEPGQLVDELYSHKGMVSRVNALVYLFRLRYPYGIENFLIYQGIVLIFTVLNLSVAKLIDRVPVLRDVI